ncbi:MAG: MlaD family protein [Microscillaceae bacterium]|nr:MlaD family protein [Microscillaceae bacterium]
MSKEVRIGLLALIAAILLYTGFNFLKGTDFISHSRYYYVIYENVSGLTISNQVKLNGLQVGKVKNIQILQDDKHKLLVTLDIRSDLILGKGTKATLGDDGLLGGKAIFLEIGNLAKQLKSGDTLVAKVTQSLVAELTEKTNPVIANVNSVLNHTDSLLISLNAEKESIAQSLQNFRDISSSLKTTLNQNQGQINSLLSNMNRLSASLVNYPQKFDPIIHKLDTFGDKLNALDLENAIQKADASLANLNAVLEKVNRGEGTLGALANDDSLYVNLNKVTENTDKLLIDFRENPKRYVNFSVFGRKKKTEENK